MTVYPDWEKSSHCQKWGPSGHISGGSMVSLFTLILTIPVTPELSSVPIILIIFQNDWSMSTSDPTCTLHIYHFNWGSDQPFDHKTTEWWYLFGREGERGVGKEDYVYLPWQVTLEHSFPPSTLSPSKNWACSVEQGPRIKVAMGTETTQYSIYTGDVNDIL